MKKTLVMIMILLVLLFSSAHAEDSYYTIREIRDQAEQLLEAYGSVGTIEVETTKGRFNVTIEIPEVDRVPIVQITFPSFDQVPSAPENGEVTVHTLDYLSTTRLSGWAVELNRDMYLSIDKLRETTPTHWSETIQAQKDIECTIDAIISVPEVEIFPVLKVTYQGINNVNLDGWIEENSERKFFFKTMSDKELGSVIDLTGKTTHLEYYYEDSLDEEFVAQAEAKARELIHRMWGLDFDEPELEKLGVRYTEQYENSSPQRLIGNNTAVDFCPVYNGIAHLYNPSPLYVIKGYEYPPYNEVRAFWREKIDYWGGVINIPRIIGEYEEDVPLLSFEKIQDTIRQHILEGYVQSIEEIRLGYILTGDPEHRGEEFYLTPGWVVRGVINAQPNLPFHPEAHNNTTRPYISMLIINAQTGEWYDVNSRDIKTFDANILTWEDVR